MIKDRFILVAATRIYNTFRIFLLVVAVPFILTSCDDDITNIGESLQPLSELMKAKRIDTLSVNAYSLSFDSILTTNFEFAMAGTMTEPVFGSSKASFIHRVRLGGSDTYPTPFKPGPTAVGDSLVVTFLPNSFYGDSATKMNMRIYRLDEDILKDDLIYSNYEPQIDMASEHSQVISVKDTLIKFVLDSTFYHPLLDGVDSIGTNEDLRGVFKGIYVTVDEDPVEGEGAIMSLDLLSTLSTVSLYYHWQDDTIKYVYDFAFNISSARANLFEHDHSIGQIANLNDTVMEDTLVYVQGIGGTYVRIDIPYLNELVHSDIRAINKAELSVKSIDYIDSTFYPPPDKLILYQKVDDVFTELFDMRLGENYFGGSFDDETSRFTFNMTSHVTDYLENPDSPFTLYLMVEGVIVAPERITLFNGTAPNNIRLKIIYTEM
jgi:hypothetical protein